MPLNDFWLDQVLDPPGYAGGGTPEQSDRVIVPTSQYRSAGIWGGTFVNGQQRRFLWVDRDTAQRHGLTIYESVADLPPTQYCSVCGRFVDSSETLSDGRCSSCSYRADATIAALTNGGRRFGIELEFSLPGSFYGGYDDDYDDLDLYEEEEYEDLRLAEECEDGDPESPGYRSASSCNCLACRQERIRDQYDRLRDSASRRRGRQLTPRSIADALSRAGVPCVDEGYTHAVMHEWKIVPDGSLENGYELVSPPMQWEQALEQVPIACATLVDLGCRATSQCGLHVHHDVGDLTPASARLLARNWNTCQPITNRLVNPDRLHSEWCYPPESYTIEEQCNFNGTQLIRFFDLDGERYRPLNWTCWHSYGTVEVRMHESTMDADEILAWIAYCQSIIEASMEGRELDPPENLDAQLKQLRIRRAARPTRTRHMLRQKVARQRSRY